MAARAKEFAPEPGRIVIVLEGGYDLPALTASTGAVLAAVAGRNLPPGLLPPEVPGKSGETRPVRPIRRANLLSWSRAAWPGTNPR